VRRAIKLRVGQGCAARDGGQGHSRQGVRAAHRRAARDPAIARPYPFDAAKAGALPREGRVAAGSDGHQDEGRPRPRSPERESDYGADRSRPIAAHFQSRSTGRHRGEAQDQGAAALYEETIAARPRPQSCVLRSITRRAVFAPVHYSMVGGQLKLVLREERQLDQMLEQGGASRSAKAEGASIWRSEDPRSARRPDGPLLDDPRGAYARTVAGRKYKTSNAYRSERRHDPTVARAPRPGGLLSNSPAAAGSGPRVFG